MESSHGIEYMFQFRMALPLNILSIVSRASLYSPEYFQETNRLLVIPMKHTSERFEKSQYRKSIGLKEQGTHRSSASTSICRRIFAHVDVTLSKEEESMISMITRIPGLSKFLEHHGWYDICYAAVDMNLASKPSTKISRLPMTIC